jgi:hypothetical protein
MPQAADIPFPHLLDIAIIEGMSLPLANVCRNKDDGIPAALRHPLIKNLNVPLCFLYKYN